MNALRRAACVLLATASFLASPAYATSFSTDQSDLYYIASESGWGIQLVQRGSVIFATLFVYGPSGQPTWYTATMDFTSDLTWTGALYATTGTYFGSSWNPAALTVTPVGTMTWSAQTVNTGVLTYVVNGVPVIKNVIRQTLVPDDFSGHYGGVFHTTNSGCADATRDRTTEFVGVVDIMQSGPTISINFSNAAGSCSFAGAYAQAGQFGSISGNYTCGGDSGTFQAFELQVNTTGFTGQFMSASSTKTGCQGTGWLGGVHVTTF